MSTSRLVTCDGCGQKTNGCEPGWIRLWPRCPEVVIQPVLLIVVERPSHGGAAFATEVDRLDYCSTSCAVRHLGGAPKS